MTEREVTLDGGVPWGFRMHGGADLKTPLRVSRVNPGSKAALRGIREGDLITSINGDSTRNLTNNEAHNLLKRAGSTLKLGLNEGSESTSKRRQYRTVHQETHQETVKKSSVTFSRRETIENYPSRGGQKFESFQSHREYLNGKDAKHVSGDDVTVVSNIPVSQKSSSSSTSTSGTLIADGKNWSSDHAVASRQSSYSNCSSIPDEGLSEWEDFQEMNNGQERLSKSKKRRQRRRNLLNRTVSQENQKAQEVDTHKTDHEAEVVNLEPTSAKIEVLRLKRIEHKYKVESPKELTLRNARKLKAKSKSLDDDDFLKIQELSEASESEDGKFQPNVVISEASSDENLLDDSDGEPCQLNLKLNDDNQLEVSNISPQEEKALRSFLGGLKLVSSPEESAKEVYDNKAKKQQKRKQLEEYFMPIAENPRYLDAISEEASSDLSDREQNAKTNSAIVVGVGVVSPSAEQAELVYLQDSSDDFEDAVEVQDGKKTELEKSSCVKDNEVDNVSHVEGDLVKKCTTEEIGDDLNNCVGVGTGLCDKLEKIDIETNNNKVSENVSTKIDEKCEIINDTYTGKKDAEVTVANITTLEKIDKDNSGEIKHNNCLEIDTEKNTPPNPNDLDLKQIDKLRTNTASNGFHQPPGNNISVLKSLSYPAEETKIKQTPEAEKNDQKNYKTFDLETSSEESFSTVLSSQTSTATNILETTAVEQLTPPLTPEEFIPKIPASSERLAFDYTRTPNVLKAKEPENGEPKITEKRSTSAVHMKQKTLNGRLDQAEFRKVKVDESLKNGDAEVLKDFEEYTIGNGTSSKQEAILKHVILTSQDSNKTDVQKLRDFENILKLNSEIKDKINKQELIGPTFRRSKTPSTEQVVTLPCDEEVPGRDFVQKRVKEFSGQNGETFEESADGVEQEKGNLVKSRIEAFSSESKDEGSVLKKILNGDIVKEAPNEKIIPVKLEEEKKVVVIPVRIDSESKPLEKIIPIKIEGEEQAASNSYSTEHIKSLNQALRNIVELKPNVIYQEQKVSTLREPPAPPVPPLPKKNQEHPPPPLPKKPQLASLLREPPPPPLPRKVQTTTEPPIPPPRRSRVRLLEKTEALDTEPCDETRCSNAVTPPRPPSASSDSTESENSSRCTAKYNPSSSLADVASLAKDEQVLEPMSLRNIVLNVLMSMPFGEAILKELAKVSETIEHLTNKLPFRTEDMWTQRDVARSVYEDERRKILELHQKFLTRRKYGDDPPVPKSPLEEDRVSITALSPANRLLTIIREEPTETEPGATDNSEERLRAKNLGEWLTLARHKSKSTSNLDCISVPINNLRRTISSTENEHAKFSNTRRRSLPQEIYEKQLIDIMEKEREIQRELEMLEEEKRKLRAEIAPSTQKDFQVDDFYVSKKGDFAERKERPLSMPVFPTEYFRQQMYEEYMDKFTERKERKQQKVIKITSSNELEQNPGGAQLKSKEIIHPIEIEQEFMDKVKQKLRKNSDDETSAAKGNVATPKDEDAPPVIVLDGNQVKGVETLPRHLQQFVDELATQQQQEEEEDENDEESIWSPGQSRRPPTPPNKHYQRTELLSYQGQNDPISPVWTPKSASSSPIVERKEFRPVNFQSPVLSRRNRTKSETVPTPDSVTSEPPWKLPEGSSDTALNLSYALDKRLPTSQSSPGLGGFSSSPRLPRAQNPTITLLQKAREGQLPRGAQYLDQDRRLPNDRPPIKYPGEVLYHIKNEYTSESDSERPRKMADLAPRKFEGIGPTTKDGMPLILRSEVKNEDQSRWYKRMYDTIHKQKPHRDEYVTIKYRQKRAQYPYTSGYLSEPEPGAYDSDFTDYKYQTLDRRRRPQNQYLYLNNNSSTMPSVPDKSYSSSDIVRNTPEKHYNRPGRIENYRPGHSSISDKEARRWWDEVMDIFDGHLEQQTRVPSLQKPRSFINQALKESGYESDSTLVFKRKEETAASQLNPKEQREVYKSIQKGGDVPFEGLRKPAPERPKEPDLPPPPPPPKSQGGVRSQGQESPRKYVENEVTIHYKTPIRTEVKDYVPEDELAHRQAETMKKIYEEERKRKYLQVSDNSQELQDMKSRRHTDNFIPSQKSPISLNRYDDFDDLAAPPKPLRARSPEPRLMAKALYNFVGQTAKELTFRKGELIYVRKQIDKNWYEGELNAMVGLFPVNYVEIVPYESNKVVTARKAYEGQARAKYNFVAQTHLELSLAKGELVTLIRKVDDNWFEGKIGGRKGIFPVAYVDVLIDPTKPPPPSSKPVASPAAHSMLLNGSSQGKESMGSHLYTPNIPNPIMTRDREKDNGYHHAKPVQLSGTGTYSTLPKSNQSPINQTLHIETQAEPVPYRALYKYTPQNDDELELLEGDTVFVLEKCDDGWYVGSSERTGAFGTFPGNYVDKI